MCVCVCVCVRARACVYIYANGEVPMALKGEAAADMTAEGRLQTRGVRLTTVLAHVGARLVSAHHELQLRRAPI